MEKAEARTQTN